jgi:PRA1 family protein 1
MNNPDIVTKEMAHPSASHMQSLLENENVVRFRDSLSHVRPWQAEFFNKEQFSRPDNFPDVQKRIGNNLKYFSSNYIIVLLILLGLSLLSNKMLIIVAGISATVFYFIRGLSEDYQIVILNRVFTKGDIKVAWLIGTIVLLWCFSVGAVLLGLIGTCTIVVALHASFHEVSIMETVDEDLAKV